MSVFFAVSLKYFWDFKHTVEILVFMNLIGVWPENTKLIIRSLDDATTMKPVTDPVFDWLED